MRLDILQHAHRMRACISRDCSKKKRLVVFASGRGSNAESLRDAMEKGRIQAEFVALITDQSGAGVIEKAISWNIPIYCLHPRDYVSKEAYEEDLLALVQSYRPDGIVLAGFMRILGPRFVETFCNRILNIHPSLLPAFPGLHAHKQALEAGVKWSGCTVHFVDGGMDTGPIIMQGVVPVLPEDDIETLSQRILIEEYKIYEKSLTLFCEDRLCIQGRKVVIDQEKV